MDSTSHLIRYHQRRLRQEPTGRARGPRVLHRHPETRRRVRRLWDRSRSSICSCPRPVHQPNQRLLIQRTDTTSSSLWWYRSRGSLDQQRSSASSFGSTVFFEAKLVNPQWTELIPTVPSRISSSSASPNSAPTASSRTCKPVLSFCPICKPRLTRPFLDDVKSSSTNQNPNGSSYRPPPPIAAPAQQVSSASTTPLSAASSVPASSSTTKVSEPSKPERRISTMSEAQIMDRLRHVVSKDDPGALYAKIKKVGQGFVPFLSSHLYLDGTKADLTRLFTERREWSSSLNRSTTAARSRSSRWISLSNRGRSSLLTRSSS
jgi:hypothetical protein